MPAIQQTPQTITLEQYETLPEDIRAEVFEGILYDMAGPSDFDSTNKVNIFDDLFIDFTDISEVLDT